MIPRITDTEVFPAAGRDCMELNLATVKGKGIPGCACMRAFR